METLQFSVDSALLRELGEKLVETVHLALIELVKNSYDADATEVRVVFDESADGRSQIQIIDNGRGMSFKAVEEYWMRIATTNKEKSNVSKIFGRPMTGAKGIGRFSCRRLGAHLSLITIGTPDGNSIGLQNKAEYTRVEFPWADFDPGTDVTEIKCKGEKKLLSKVDTGTTLIIQEISEEWGYRGYSWLKRQLAVLSANTGTRRSGYKEDKGFTVYLSAPDFEGGVQDVREGFMDSGWGTLTAYVNSKNQAVCELDAIGIGKKSIISNFTFNHLKDVKLALGIFVDDKSQMRNTSFLNLGSLARILPEWGGVQVRYRNFRVYPYGDDDWLDIDHDRGLRRGQPKNELFAFAQKLHGVDAARALLNMLSMRSYVGSVSIGERATGFNMKLNREGFVASPAVDELKTFVRFAIDWSTILRDYYLRQQAQRASQEALVLFEDVIHRKIEPTQLIETAVNYLVQEVREITKGLPEVKRFETEESVFKATDVILKHNASNKAELLHLRLVASTSTLLLIFSHEVKSLLGVLEESKNSLNIIVRSKEEIDRKEISKVANGFGHLKERLEELLGLTSLVSIDHRRAKSGNVALRNRVERVVKVFDLITSKYKITIDYDDIPANLVVKDILEAELYSILLNSVSNSIKSVIAGSNKRHIKISAEREGGYNIIKIMDNGLGIAESNFEEVFTPFISDPSGNLYFNLEKQLNPEDKIIVGSGSGLGLGILREIVTAHNGIVKFISPSDKWKAILQINLP